MSNPTLVTGYGQFYYLCDRDPTPTELNVLDPNNYGEGVYVNLPDFKYMWFNSNTKTAWVCLDNTFNAMDWQEIITDKTSAEVILTPNNLELLKMSLGYQINNPRSYVQRTSPSFNTSYIPSTTNDTFIIANINIVLSLLQNGVVNAQIDSGSGFVTVASAAKGAVAIDDRSSISFIVPANASYRLTNSGTGTITLDGIMELSL